MNEQVDILVLAHNSLNITKQFISTLYEHTENFDLWILDNGSSDGTTDWLYETTNKNNYTNLVMTQTDNNLGVIGGRNALYEEYERAVRTTPKANYICFLDNDQLVSDGWLEQHMSVIKSGKDIVGVEAWNMSKNFYPIRINSIFQEFVYVGCGGMLMKAEVPKKIGMFDAQFSPAYFEDPDFCFRAAEAGYKIGWNYANKIVHKAHSTLGKTDWRKAFESSWTKFSKKWVGKPMKRFRQERLTDGK